MDRSALRYAVFICLFGTQSLPIASIVHIFQVTMKDDTGRSVLELERIKRQLEAELASAKETITELEDNLQLTEDAKLRLDVTLQATNVELEKVRNDKERDDDERRKVLLRKVFGIQFKIE